MEELLFTSNPTKDFTNLILLSTAFLLLLGLIILVQQNKIKKLEGNFRQIALVLGGLITLILLATALLTAWNLNTVQKVELFETYMESYHGRTYYKDISRAGIYKDKQNSFINPQVTIRQDNILVVEKRDKKLLLFSEENYDINELVKEIRDRMDEQ